MKRLILFIAFIAAMAMANAQAPAAFKYQAVVRNSAGTVIANQNVSFRIGILQGSVSGAVAYSESHVATTNNFGLVSLEIGQGAAPMGNLAELDWSAGPYFVKIEVDPAGGTDYIEMSTTQLLSVPYALYANKANESDPIFSASVAKGIG